MKFFLDACVLYPTVMREMLIGAAGAGFYTPLWSERVLEEWRRAAIKLGPEGAAQAQTETALLNANWPKASVTYAPSLEDRLWLPDPADTHVLAGAIAGNADGIVTMNAKDFPRNILAEEGVSRNDPDGFLMGFHAANPEAMQSIGEKVREKADALSGEVWTIRALMKKARLPRLGKALAAAD